MNEDIFVRKKKKKFPLTSSEALYKATLETLRYLDFGTQIYHPNLFKSYRPTIQIQTNQTKRKEAILKVITHPHEKHVHFETDVGLGKPETSKNLQSHQGKVPLKIGTSRILSVSSAVMEKLDISLVKPIASFGIEQIFVPSPYRNKTSKAKKRRRNRKKKVELQAIKAPELEESISSTSGDKKYLCKKIVCTLKEHIMKQENISNVKTKYTSIQAKESPSSHPIILGDEVTPQKRIRTSIESSETNQKVSKHETKSSDIKTNELLKQNTGSCSITAEFFKVEEELHNDNKNDKSLQQVGKNHKILKNEVEQLDIHVKESLEPNINPSTKITEPAENSKETEVRSIDIAGAPNIQEKEFHNSCTTVSEANVKILDPVPNEKPKKLDSKTNKSQLTESSTSKMNQKTCEPKAQESAIDATENTTEKNTRGSHLRKQIAPQKINNPGLKLLTSITETARNDSTGPSNLFNQPIWDHTARPRFNIQLQPVSLEAQRSEIKLSETEIFPQTPDVAAKQQVLVKIQSTETKVTRPNLNIEMQSVPTETNISLDKGVPNLNKSLSTETLPCEITNNHQFSSKIGFKVPSHLLREKTLISTELESLDSKRKPRPRPSYSTQSKPSKQINKPYKLSYEEITPPEILETLKAKESQLPPSGKDDKGQPILRLRLHANLPEPRPRRNIAKLRPLRSASMDTSRMAFQNIYREKHSTHFEMPWKNVSYVVDSFASPEEISATEKLRKLLPPLKTHNAKLRKVQSETKLSEGSNLASSSSEFSNLEYLVQNTKYKISPNTQSELSKNLKFEYPEPKEQRVRRIRPRRSELGSTESHKFTLQPESSEIHILDTPLPALENKKVQSDLVEIHKSESNSFESKSSKLESSPPESNKEIIKIEKTSCTESESNEISASDSPSPEPRIRRLTFSRSEPSRIGRLSCCTSGPDEIPKTSCTPEPSRIQKLESPSQGPSGIYKSASLIPRNCRIKPTTPTLVSSKIRTSKPSKVYKSVYGTSQSIKTSKIKSHSSRYKQKTLQFRKSSYTQSKSGGSHKSVSPPREFGDNRKYSLPQVKIQKTKPKDSPHVQSESPSKDSSDIHKIKYISTKSKTQTAKRRPTYTNPSRSHKSLSQKLNGNHKKASPDPNENDSSTLLPSLSNGNQTPSSDSNLSNKFANYPPDSNANLAKLPFLPPQPAGFRKLSRKVRYLKQRAAFYDSRGIHIESGKDVCDCLVPKCKGCFSSCPKCHGTKCGMNCRVNRKYVLDEAVFEGSNTVHKFENCL